MRSSFRNANPGGRVARASRSESHSAQQPTVTVGVSDLAIQRGHGTVITHALGSCVAVCGYDATTKIAGILHALLPQGKQEPERSLQQPATFADAGVVALKKALIAAGAAPAAIRAKLVAAAAVLNMSERFTVGQRNIFSARKALWKAQIPIDAEEVGGRIVRTVWIDVQSGALRIRTPGMELRTL